MNGTTSVLLAGVGGQGVLRASDILAEALMLGGYDVKKSEVHGMAQRGGSVTSYVRFGERVYSPTAAKGTARIMLSFEKMETLRHIEALAPGGMVIVSDEEINPPVCNLGLMEYPRDIDGFIRTISKNVYHIPAVAIARETGSPRAANTVLLGVLSQHLPLSPRVWKKVLQKSFPAKLIPLNLAAFERGRAV